MKRVKAVGLISHADHGLWEDGVLIGYTDLYVDQDTKTVMVQYDNKMNPITPYLVEVISCDNSAWD